MHYGDLVDIQSPFNPPAPTVSNPPSGAAKGDPAEREGLRDQVQEAIAGQLEILDQQLLSISPDALILATSGRRLAEGGKRLRAAFCYWGWRGASATHDVPGREIYQACASLELFQVAALVHDDIMDCSDTRRGAPAVHREFEALHRDSGWAGDGTQFGESGGLLVGDLFLIESDRLFARSMTKFAPATQEVARSVFDQMRTEVTIGQYLDVLAEVTPWGEDPAADLQRSRTIVKAKAARYSVEHPLVLGAALGGVPQEDLHLWSAVGLPVGEAFQLRDDLLGVFGDPTFTGKPAGDDLREGKRTVLANFAYEAGNVAERNRLRSALGNPSLSDQDIAEVREILTRTGAVQRVELLIEELLVQAYDSLAKLDLGSIPLEALHHLIVAATNRSA